jgi:hypothetical protein
MIFFNNILLDMDNLIQNFNNIVLENENDNYYILLNARNENIEQTIARYNLYLREIYFDDELPLIANDIKMYLTNFDHHLKEKIDDALIDYIHDCN